VATCATRVDRPLLAERAAGFLQRAYCALLSYRPLHNRSTTTPRLGYHHSSHSGRFVWSGHGLAGHGLAVEHVRRRLLLMDVCTNCSRHYDIAHASATEESMTLSRGGLPPRSSAGDRCTPGIDRRTSVSAPRL